MKAFLVGLAVLALMGIFSVASLLLFPVLIVLGIFFRILLGFFLILFAIWLTGKLTLWFIDYLRKKEPPTIV
jgi:hypothetical protein